MCASVWASERARKRISRGDVVTHQWIFKKKEKREEKKKNPGKAKQVEQTSVFALQMCAETTRASKGKHKETSENPWWSGCFTRLQMSPLIVLLFSVGYGWVRGGVVDPSRGEPATTWHRRDPRAAAEDPAGFSSDQFEANSPPRMFALTMFPSNLYSCDYSVVQSALPSPAKPRPNPCQSHFATSGFSEWIWKRSE